MTAPIFSRLIAVGLIWNQRGELLFCRMKPDRGVFPGQWGFPGGGIEPGEQMTDALQRELREEIGIEVDRIRLNEEFSEYRWVSEAELPSLDLNEVTVDTLSRIDWEITPDPDER